MSERDREPTVRVIGLDHVVFRVADVERSLAFYTGTLGLAPVRVDEWRAGEVLFPSVRVDAHTIIDIFPRELARDDGSSDAAVARNVDHVCLVLEPCDLAALAASGTFDVVGGPAELFGARGQGQGLYVRDPDGNVVELRHYASA
jgi:catechol 2,3-dioxygenase-like lactoylglutathione lyase family enzyme